MKLGGLAQGRKNALQKMKASQAASSKALEKKPAAEKITEPEATAAEIAAVKLDAEEEELLEQMEQVAADRGEYFDEEGEREQLKALKADELKKRMKKMKTGGLAIGRLNMMQKQKIATAKQEASEPAAEEITEPEATA